MKTITLFFKEVREHSLTLEVTDAEYDSFKDYETTDHTDDERLVNLLNRKLDLDFNDNTCTDSFLIDDVIIEKHE